MQFKHLPSVVSFYNLYAYLQVMNESEGSTLHQVDLTSTDISCYQYILQYDKKDCRGMNLSREIDLQISGSQYVT